MIKKTHKLSSIEQDILSNIQSGSAVTDAFAPLMKRVMEAALQGEIDNHLEKETSQKNYRNGTSTKTMKSSLGEFELETPRDRNSDFSPEIIKKRQTVMTDEFR